MNFANYYLLQVVLCCCLVGTKATAQETMPNSGFYLRLGAAFTSIPEMANLGPLAGKLTGLPPRNLSLSPEIVWQTNAHLGFTFLYRRINIVAPVRPDFAAQLALEFPDDFVTISPPGIRSKRSARLSQTFFTVFYAAAAGKWSLQPRLMLGATNFTPTSATVVLKRRNSNQLSLLTLQSNAPNTPLSKTTFGVGFLAERNLWRRWSLFGTAEYTRFKSNLGYIYSLEDEVYNTSVTQELAGNKFVQMVHIGAGISFRISK